MSSGTLSDVIDARIGDFEVLKTLGRGGMGMVYEARHRPTGTRVALKVVQRDLAGDADLVARFRREVLAASRVDHPNVCRVVAGGVADDELFLALEFADGQTGTALKRAMGGRMPIALALEVARQVLVGLGAVHAEGIVHRDVKPSNVVVTREGVVKLLDFGIAKTVGDATLTGSGGLVGTPGFMSPEQARGELVDARSDLFAVGLMAHDLIGGRSPFASDSPAEGLARVIHDRAPPLSEVSPGVSLALDRWCARLTAPDPSDRYPNAADAMRELRPILGEAIGGAGLVEAIGEPRAVAVRARDALVTQLVARSDALAAAGNGRAAALAAAEALRANPDDERLQALSEERADAIAVSAPATLEPAEAEALAAVRARESPALWRHLANLRLERADVVGAVAALRRAILLRPSSELLEALAGCTGELVETAPAPSTEPVAAPSLRPALTPAPLEGASGAIEGPTPTAAIVPWSKRKVSWPTFGLGVLVGIAVSLLALTALVLWETADEPDLSALEPEGVVSPTPGPRPAPLRTLDRSRLSIEGPALVNVWLEGCLDCMPAFEAWRDTVDRGELPRGLPVYNVAYGKFTSRFVRSYRVGAGVRSDPGGEIVRPLGITTFTTLLVGPNGEVMGRLKPTDGDYVARIRAFDEATIALPR